MRGNVPYGAEYVARLRDAVQRHLPLAHDFVCLTDRPGDLPAGVCCLPAECPAPMPLPGWWAKVQLFRPGLLPEGERILYLDLDTLVVEDLTPLAEWQLTPGIAEMALIDDSAGTFRPRTHHEVVHRFNSSVMVWNAGAARNIYTRWAPEIADRLWGDQDWIGEVRDHEDVFPPEWTPRLSALGDPPVVPPEARIVLCKKPKNTEAVRRWPHLRKYWH